MIKSKENDSVNRRRIVEKVDISEVEDFVRGYLKD